MTACHGSGGSNLHDTNHTMDQCNIETVPEPPNELDVAKLAADKSTSSNKRKYAECVLNEKHEPPNELDVAKLAANESTTFDWLHGNIPRPKPFHGVGELTV
jgi:predicted outer membrane protein